MQNRKRRHALILCIGLILTLLLSSFYIASCGDHECCGSDCEICEHLAEASVLLRSFSWIVLFTVSYLAHCFFSRGISDAGETVRQRTGSLFCLKVRLNN